MALDWFDEPYKSEKFDKLFTEEAKKLNLQILQRIQNSKDKKAKETKKKKLLIKRRERARN